MFTFENQGTNTYLVYKVLPEDTVDTLSLGMLTNNKILGLAQTVFTQMDTTKYIKFNVSSKISVKQFFSGSVNKKRLTGVFTGIVNAMLSAEDYMIDTNSILLDLDYIFADVSTCETVLICLPVNRETNEKVDLGTFFKNIMFGTQFDQTENCDHVAKIINYLNSVPVFSLTEFKAVLDGINKASPPRQVPPYDPPRPATYPPRPGKIEHIPMPHTEVLQPGPADCGTPNFQPIPKVPDSPKQGNPPIHQPGPKVPKTPVIGDGPLPGKFDVPKTSGGGGQAYTPGSPPDGEKISWGYLMQHYNKENAAKYKAQKEEKKAKKASSKSSKKAGTNDVPGAPSKNPGMAIPGQPIPIPGQPIPIPGQPVPIPGQPVPIPGQPPVQPPSPKLVPPQIPTSSPGQPPVQTSPVYTPPVYTPPVGGFGNTTVLSGEKIGETTVLGNTSAEVKIKPHLVRTKNNEKINLNKPVFRIGKEKSYVDYFISDNSAISRSHANIITREGEYFIIDTNSTNHTYLNGTMLQSNVEIKLEHGNRIRFANEEFEFKLY